LTLTWFGNYEMRDLSTRVLLEAACAVLLLLI
jgi:hypothetical protein